MRPVAVTLALFWSLQVLVCLVPGAPAAASAGEGHGAAPFHHHGLAAATHAEGHAAHAHHHHSSSSAPGGPESESDRQCEQHCASLKQVLAAAASAPPAPAVSVALPPALPSVAGPRALPAAVARRELERPPPDILALHATLRI